MHMWLLRVVCVCVCLLYTVYVYIMYAYFYVNDKYHTNLACGGIIYQCVVYIYIYIYIHTCIYILYIYTSDIGPDPFYEIITS